MGDDEELDDELLSEGTKLRGGCPDELCVQTAVATLGIEIAVLKAGEVELRMTPLLKRSSMGLFTRASLRPRSIQRASTPLSR